MQSPFKFLDAYTLEDKDVFFGRDKEVEELYDAVSKNRLVLVYGQSGTGKTSLVQCGLASRFDATDWYPLFIRRQDDINRALGQALEKAAKRKLEGGLADSLRRLNARFLRPIYLIFDQLEELLILGRREEQQAFIRSLQEILNAEDLSCHVILILREEYIAHLYPFEQAIPTLFDRRLRVEPMSNTRVREVLRSSFAAFNISLEAPEENITQIIENVSAERSGIQLPYLQVYLDMLWRRSVREEEKGRRGEGERPPLHKAPADEGRQTADGSGAPDQPITSGASAEEEINPINDFPSLHFTSREITELGRIEEVLEKFLQEQEIALQREMERQYPGFPEQGVRQALDAFVTAEGTKRPVGFHREGQDIVLEEKVAKLLPNLAVPPSGVKGLAPSAEAPSNRRTLNRGDSEGGPPSPPFTPSPSPPFTPSPSPSLTPSPSPPLTPSPSPPLTTLLQALETRRLLRFSDDSIELAHDSLADLIDKRRTDEQRQLNEVKVRLAGSYLEWQRTGEFLTRKQLLSIEPFLERLALEPHLERFVQESYAYNEQAEEAERQKQQAELDKERRLRGEAEQNEKRARQRTRVAALLALLSVVALFFAVQQFGKAKTEALRAEDKAAEAQLEKLRADTARYEAELERQAAEASRDSTQDALQLADSLGDEAEIAARNARQALAGLQAATAQLLDSTLSDAQRDILDLDYKSALVKYQNAAELGIEPRKVGEALMEIAFFRTEAGQHESAWVLAEQVAGLYRQPFRKPASAPQDERQALRDILKGLDANRYQELELRYFPEMVDVPGGHSRWAVTL
ncbi:MAG: AAA family ATPase [Phaeodactylibacter sp.]|nr:AAA family ATPase [Phaeodactylibacter sp.]